MRRSIGRQLGQVGCSARGQSIALLLTFMWLASFVRPSSALAQTHIACGQTLSGNIASVGQQDVYGFSGVAGEAVVIASVGTSGTLDARAQLYGPTGTLLGGNYGNGASGVLTLPTTGTYTVVVADWAVNKTGGYNVNVQFTTGRCGTAITCGQTLGGTIGVAQQNSYTFAGTAGEAVVIASVGTSGTLDARAQLY